MSSLRCSLAIVSVLLFASLSQAKTVCKEKTGKGERTVEIVYAEAGKKTPCEVKYAKSGETEAKSIFSAKTQEGFCESKAAEFTEKLKGMGLECSGD